MHRVTEPIKSWVTDQRTYTTYDEDVFQIEDNFYAVISKKILEELDKHTATKFLNELRKEKGFIGKIGESGIKIINGCDGIKAYELKIIGNSGDKRLCTDKLYTNGETGLIIFDFFAENHKKSAKYFNDREQIRVISVESMKTEDTELAETKFEGKVTDNIFLAPTGDTYLKSEGLIVDAAGELYDMHE